MRQLTGGISPRLHFNPLEVSIVSQLSQLPVKFRRFLPEFQLDRPEAMPNPAHQLPELMLAVAYPEVVGEASQYGIEVTDDLFKVDRRISPGDRFDPRLEACKLFRLYPGVSGDFPPARGVADFFQSAGFAGFAGQTKKCRPT